MRLLRLPWLAIAATGGLLLGGCASQGMETRSTLRKTAEVAADATTRMGDAVVELCDTTDVLGLSVATLSSLKDTGAAGQAEMSRIRPVLIRAHAACDRAVQWVTKLGEIVTAACNFLHETTSRPGEAPLCQEYMRAREAGASDSQPVAPVAEEAVSE